MKNIFIEGIPGSGKSRLLQEIHARIPGLHVCREGDYSPVGLIWCTWMTKAQYETVLERYKMIRTEIIKNTFREGDHYIITYTKILTDIPGFHKNLENYEIHDGRIPFHEFKHVVFARYGYFHGHGYLSECVFMQNIMATLMLFYQLSDDDIMEFYRQLFDKIDKDKFSLLYLYCGCIEEIIRTIKAQRTDQQGNTIWYDTMNAYIRQSPFGESYGDKSTDRVVEYLQHRQQLEMRIMDDIVGKYGNVITAKQWDLDQVLDVIQIRS